MTLLRTEIQKAIKLEHAVIPLYMSALMSIKPGKNTEIYKLIRTIMIEEMLHLAMTCNMLIACGGTPEIAKKGFVNDYVDPNTLPGGTFPGTTFQLGVLTKAKIFNEFMVIESPKEEIHYEFNPTNRTAIIRRKNPKQEDKTNTIGQFYDNIKKGVFINKDTIITDMPALEEKQSFFPAMKKMFRIRDFDSLVDAIDLITE